MYTPIDPLNTDERLMMVQPNHGDVGERCEIGEIRRPLMAQRHQQLAFSVVRILQVQHQQGDHDGEDAVAERFQAIRFG